MLAKDNITEYRKKMNKVRHFLYDMYSKQGETDRMKSIIDKIYKICVIEGMK